MHKARAAWASGCLAALLTLAGCGGSTAEVSGTVKYDGKEIPTGTIMFLPADGQGKTAGGPIKDGRYSVPGVAVGTMKVSISAPKVVDKKKLYPTPDSPYADVTEEALPHKYNEKTELKLDVVRGSNQKDWDLPK